MAIQLSPDEKELLDSFESEEWESVMFPEELRKYQEAARNTFRKDKRVNIRISGKDLELLQVHRHQLNLRLGKEQVQVAGAFGPEAGFDDGGGLQEVGDGHQPLVRGLELRIPTFTPAAAPPSRNRRTSRQKYRLSLAIDDFCGYRRYAGKLLRNVTFYLVLAGVGARRPGPGTGVTILTWPPRFAKRPAPGARAAYAAGVRALMAPPAGR